MNNNNLISIVAMWCEINKLSKESLSQSQIALKLGISRDTVRRYQRMSENEFNDRLGREFLRRKHKLDAYEDFITNMLQEFQFLSSTQVHDRLKEHFIDFPEVSERTVYNMVQSIRIREDLPKVSESVRQMSKVPDCEYGEKCQVDYGEKILQTPQGRNVKVYFIVFVLQRSRYKYVYFQNIPFTAKTTVYAHHLAFKFFGGMPAKMIYDQDRKILVKENFGDYLMTTEFAQYVAEVGFKPIFCMPFDPASKGLSEATVKYVKRNFLPGRRYINIDRLNEECIGWLSRTANAKVNASTKLVPDEEFKKEKTKLCIYPMEMDEPEIEAREYGVRKDNTLLYHSNFYSLPLGTYAGQGTKVMVVKNVDLNEIEIYDPKDFSLITRHKICPFRGKYITKEGHASNKNRDILESEKTLRTFFGQWDDDSLLSRFLASIRENRPRYYPKTVKSMASLFTDYDKSTALRLLEQYAERKVYNANNMADIARTMADRMAADPKPTKVVISSGLDEKDITPQKRNVSEYDEIINGGKK